MKKLIFDIETSGKLKLQIFDFNVGGMSMWGPILLTSIDWRADVDLSRVRHLATLIQHTFSTICYSTNI